MSNSLKKLYYLNPQIYKLIFGNINLKKADFINKLIARYVPTGKKISILDIGCGTGDILNALKASNRFLVGIDKSASMIKFAKEQFQGIQFLIGDMTKLRSKKGFDIAICMSSTFMYNITNDQINATVKRLETLVRNEGILVLDLVNFIVMLRDKSFKEIIRESYDYKGFKAKMTIRNMLLLEQQAVKSVWKWDIKDLNNTKPINHIVNESTTFRMFFPKEVEWLLAEHNFRALEMFSDYNVNSNNLNGHRMIFVAKKLNLVKREERI